MKSISELYHKGEKMINGFEYRDNLPKCPERSDRWLSPSSYECDECEEYGEDGDGDEPSEDSHQEPSDDELAYQEFLDEFGKK